MKRQSIRIHAVAGLLLAASGIPAHAVNKDMVQLQTQVQTLVDQVQKLQQSIDERMGVMRSLIEQTTDNINKINGNLDGLNKALELAHTDTNGKVDQVSAQVQQLNDSVDELKARIAKVSKQLDDVQSAQQNLAAPPPAAPAQVPCMPGQTCTPEQPGGQGQPGQITPGAPGVLGSPAQPGTPPAAQSQAPPPDVLYNNSLRDYNAGKYDLAVQEFGDYLKYYPTTDLAGNAQFYLADIEYRQEDYKQAILDYDKVLEQYPGGNKTAAAQLKKGFALLAVGQQNAGTKELRNLIARYPRSLEASQARDRLHRMETAPTASRRAQQ